MFAKNLIRCICLETSFNLRISKVKQAIFSVSCHDSNPNPSFQERANISYKYFLKIARVARCV